MSSVRRVHFRRRLPPPHRAQHLGKQRRSSAAAGHDGTVSHRDPLSDPACAGGCAPSRGQRRHSARRRQRPRRQRGALTCAIPTRTALNSIGTGRRSNGRASRRFAGDVHGTGSIWTICCGKGWFRFSSFRDGPKDQTRNPRIPGSMRSLSSGRASRGPVGVAREYRLDRPVRRTKNQRRRDQLQRDAAVERQRVAARRIGAGNPMTPGPNA